MSAHVTSGKFRQEVNMAEVEEVFLDLCKELDKPMSVENLLSGL